MELFFKDFPASIEARGYSSEDETISSDPDRPSCQNNNFHVERYSKEIFQITDLMLDTKEVRSPCREEVFLSSVFH